MPANAQREYLLERWRGESVVDAYVFPNVSSYERRPIPALSREWTAASRPVKQSAGIREEEIRLAGVSGQNPTGLFTVQGGNLRSILSTAGVQVTTANASLVASSGSFDGVAYFEGLMAFIAQYEADAAKYRSVWVQDPALAPTMVFRDIGGGLAWYVDDMQIVPVSRVGGSRNSYEYTFSCKTEGRAQARQYKTLTNTPTAGIPVAERQVTGTMADVLRPASAGTDAAGNAIATQATATPTQSLVQVLEDIPGDMQFYAPPLRAFMAQTENFATIATTALRAGLGIPRDAARNFRGYAETCSRIVYGLWDATNEPMRDRAQAVRDDILAGVNAVRQSIGTLLGSAGSKLGGTDHPVTLGGGASGSGAEACSVERVARGEDLQAFAFRVLGTLARWDELAVLNGMSSPWTLADGSPLTPGTPLLVPLPLPDSFERAPDGDLANVYMTDLLWDFDAFDFVCQGTEPTDFLAVTGASNLRQGLLTRFTTAQGGCLVRPAMGLPDTIGDVATPARAAVKASQVVTQAGADPRVRAVRSVRFVQTANVQRAEIDVEPILDAGAFSVSVPV